MKKDICVFLFCDALGFEIVSTYHFMEQELPFRYPARTQLGYSSTAVPTILTGKPPTEHRHLSFFYRNPSGYSPFKIFKILQYFLHPRIFFNHHRVRHQISKLIKKICGFTGYFSLYQVPYERLSLLDYCEKKDIFAPCGLAPIPNLHDMLDKTGINFHISNWRRSDKENLDEAKKLITERATDLMFIYTAEIDGMLHFNVKDPEVVSKRLKAYSAEVKGLLEAAAVNGDNLRLFVISDHGMTPHVGTVDLKSRLEATPFRFGTDYIACYDSTMLRLYVLNPLCREELLRSVDGAPGKWLSEQEKKDFNLDFDDAMYGDEIYLLEPGYQLVPSDMSSKAIPGMHGYTPDDIYSTASLLSNVRPDFVPEEISGFFDLIRREAEKLAEDR